MYFVLFKVEKSNVPLIDLLFSKLEINSINISSSLTFLNPIETFERSIFSKSFDIFDE